MPSSPPSSLGLAIDTSFDDTSLAVLSGIWRVDHVQDMHLHSHITLSQSHTHQRFGGVVPERAARQHLEVIHPLLEEVMEQAGVEFSALDWIAVTHMPGLVGSLLIGMTVAKTLSYALQIPLLGINHVEAHPYACFLSGTCFVYPILHLIVAGGHTVLILQRDPEEWHSIGRTRDDSAGECADKVARLFGLPMPGGKYVDAAAQAVSELCYIFPKPFLKESHFDFSFSGLKSALQRFVRAHPEAPQDSVLAAFMHSMQVVLLEKTFRAAQKYNVQMVTLSGGFGASVTLRNAFRERAAKEGIAFACPTPHFCTDNAAMIGVLGLRHYATGCFETMRLRACPNLPLPSPGSPTGESDVP